MKNDPNELAKQLVDRATEERGPAPVESSENLGRVKRGANKGRVRRYKPRWRELLGFSEPKA